MAPRVGVVLFPGSNCEQDVIEAVNDLGANGSILWHGNPGLGDVDAVVIPGGFAHGDYLRPGAIARFSPIMRAIIEFANDGGPVLGVCNGFQVLTESGVLPGALQKNSGLKFLCAMTELTVSSTRSVLTAQAHVGDILRVPVNHFSGNYICDAQTLAELKDNDQIVLTYRDNPNGSMGNIAGISNLAGNVVGLMPHPERACHPLIGSGDGVVLLRSFLSAAAGAATPARA
jgi:phosphoribosylformylglycinamidine synthase I